MHVALVVDLVADIEGLHFAQDRLVVFHGDVQVGQRLQNQHTDKKLFSRLLFGHARLDFELPSKPKDSDKCYAIIMLSYHCYSCVCENVLNMYHKVSC